LRPQFKIPVWDVSDGYMRRLLDAVSEFDEGSVKLRGMVGEMAKVQDSGHALDGLD